MTDKPAKTEHVFGCGWNDPKPRMAGRIPQGGYGFQVSSTEGPDPSAGAAGHKVQTVKHVKDQN